MEEKKYLKAINYTGYGLGGFGQCFVMVFSNFLLLFLTDTIGMDVGVVGTLMMVSKIFDGISDIIFGTLLDRTHTKMGKSRPWILGTAIPLGIFQLLLYFTPVRANILQYVYFFIAYSLLNAVFYTANGVAFNSLSITITKNQIERVKMGVVLTVAVLTGSILVSSATIGLVQFFGSGVNGWRITALIYTVTIIICEIVCVFTIKEAETTDEQENTPKDKQLTLINSIKYLVKNKYYLLILAYYIIYYFSSGVIGAAGTYYCIHVLKKESLYGIFSAATMMPMIIGVFFTPALVKKYGMYKTNTFTLLVSACSCILLVFGGYSRIILLLITGLVLKSLFFGPLSGSVNAIIAEISNYETLKNGIHLEGTMFSCVSMGQKLGGGIASAVSGWMLSLAHYNGMLTVQPQSAIKMIEFLYLIIPSICSIIIYLIIKKINVWDEIERLKRTS